MSDDEYKAARELESKFQFYFTALAFTILGLAIQTAPDQAPAIARVFELLAWVLLLAAGLASLWYLEILPVRRLAKIERDDIDRELRLRDAQMAPATDFSTVFHGIHTNQLRSYRKDIVSELKKSKKREHLKYQVARICLVAGLIATGIARGYPLVQEISGVTKSAKSKLILTTPN